MIELKDLVLKINNIVTEVGVTGKENQNRRNFLGRRDNSRYNGVRGSNSSPKTEDSFNSSSSSDTKVQRSPKERKEEIVKVSFEINSTYDVSIMPLLFLF